MFDGQSLSYCDDSGGGSGLRNLAMACGASGGGGDLFIPY